MLKSGLPKKEGKMRIRAFPVSFQHNVITYVHTKQCLVCILVYLYDPHCCQLGPLKNKYIILAEMYVCSLSFNYGILYSDRMIN